MIQIFKYNRRNQKFKEFRVESKSVDKSATEKKMVEILS